MQQYKQMISAIFKNGTPKPPARGNMPGSISLFGYQTQYDLSKGFPILTTRKISFKNIVTELLWMLKGAGNIKYLVNNGCNIWNEDAYKYYKKCFFESGRDLSKCMTFETFVDLIKKNNVMSETSLNGKYNLGDCPLGYEKWRKWNKVDLEFNDEGYITKTTQSRVDQIVELIQNLTNNPQKRNHLLTAYDPTYKDVALDPCHILAQFNCRPLSNNDFCNRMLHTDLDLEDAEKTLPKYYLDCKLYQRSADSILGVPYNTASYALLTHLLAKMCNMIPGIFTHSFGDLHIYDNHIEIWNENQASREPMKLPTLAFSDEFSDRLIKWSIGDVFYLSEFIELLEPSDFSLENYEAHPVIKYPLSTGLFLI